MKLAEALEARKALKKRAEDLRQRLEAAATHQEGSEPLENPQALLNRLIETYEELANLTSQINYINQRYWLENGITLAEAVVRRDHLIQLQQALQRVLGEIRDDVKGRSFGRSETRIVLALDIRQIQEQIDRIGEEARHLNVMIQQANWQADL